MEISHLCFVYTLGQLPEVKAWLVQRSVLEIKALDSQGSRDRVWPLDSWKFKNHVKISAKASVGGSWKMSPAPEGPCTRQRDSVQTRCPALTGYALCLKFILAFKNNLLHACYLHDTISGVCEAVDHKTDQISVSGTLDLPAHPPSACLENTS